MRDSVDIHKADPRAQRLAVASLLGGAAVGVLLLTVLPRYRPAFVEWVRQDPASRLRLVLGILALVLSAPLFAMAAYLWRLSTGITSSGRFPPPGARLVKDTPVLSGESAAQRAALARTAAGLLIAGGLILGFMFWRLAHMLAPV